MKSDISTSRIRLSVSIFQTLMEFLSLNYQYWIAKINLPRSCLLDFQRPSKLPPLSIIFDRITMKSLYILFGIHTQKIRHQNTGQVVGYFENVNAKHQRQPSQKWSRGHRRSKILIDFLWMAIEIIKIFHGKKLVKILRFPFWSLKTCARLISSWPLINLILKGHVSFLFTFY